MGGGSGEYIVNKTQERDVLCFPMWVEGTTRINLFVKDSEQEFKFVGSGAPVSRRAQQQMLEQIEMLPDMDLLTVSGSLSPNMDTDFYDRLVEVCRRKSIPFVFDISNDYLKTLASQKPLLIKPNDEELRNVFGLSCTDEEQITASLNQLHRMGFENILLTLGKRGMYFSNRERLWFTQGYPVETISSACAGDGALAAFLSIWFYDRSRVEAALCRACAVGADIAGSLGLGHLKRISTYEKHIRVTEVLQWQW